MELNYVLGWMVGASCAGSLVNILKVPNYWRTGWNIKSILIFFVLLLGLILFPTKTGLVAGTLFSIFLVVPILLLRVIRQDTEKQNYLRAHKLMLLLKYLHPLDGMREHAKFLFAFELRRQGKFAEAEKLLASYEWPSGKIAQIAKLHLMYIRYDWQGIVQLCSSMPEPILVQSLEMLSHYLRALGELGKPNEMLRVFALSRKNTEKLPKHLRDSIRFIVYAFSGEGKALKKIFLVSLRHYPQSLRELWIRTSEMTAGLVDKARHRFTSIKNSTDLLEQKFAERRLAFQLPIASAELTHQSVKILQEDIEAFTSEEHFENNSRSLSPPLVTYAIMAMCLAVFCAEIIFGGTTNVDTLFYMGALEPSLVEGEWWRIFSSQFLHYGWLHLAMNLFALQALGPFVERKLGWFRYIGLYVGSGACSMLSLIFLSTHHMLEIDLVVGASASIMGLVGATIAISLLGWFRHREAIARKRLGPMLLLVGLQIVFDFITPQVSMAAHLSGIFFGSLIVIISSYLQLSSKTT